MPKAAKPIRQLNYPPELTEITAKYGVRPELSQVCAFYGQADKEQTLRRLWDDALGNVERVLQDTRTLPHIYSRVMSVAQMSCTDRALLVCLLARACHIERYLGRCLVCVMSTIFSTRSLVCVMFAILVRVAQHGTCVMANGPNAFGYLRTS